MALLECENKSLSFGLFDNAPLFNGLRVKMKKEIIKNCAKRFIKHMFYTPYINWKKMNRKWKFIKEALNSWDKASDEDNDNEMKKRKKMGRGWDVQ